jgi:hypothetical protein
MPFSNPLDTSLKELPSTWKKYLIRYNDLKEAIYEIVNEIQQRGLSVHILNEWLHSSSLGDECRVDNDNFQIKYYFAGIYSSVGF